MRSGIVHDDNCAPRVSSVGTPFQDDVDIAIVRTTVSTTFCKGQHGSVGGPKDRRNAERMVATLATFEDGLKYMQFTEAVARSIATGQAVPV